MGTGPGNSLDWAAEEARRIIHDNDAARLKQLLAEYPALLSWRNSTTDGGLLGLATSSYGDSFDASREQAFTRAACAELLIDAGAAVTPSIVDGLIQSRARGLLQLLHGKGVLPHALRFRAALGDLDAVRASLDESGDDLAAINDAFMCACRFEHEGIALLLLARSIALDPTLGAHVDGGMGRLAFVKFLSAERALTFTDAAPAGPWQSYLMERLMRAVQEGDLPTFVDGLKREPWLLGESESGFQVGLVERAAVRDRGEFIAALLDLDPALVRRQPPPSQAIEFALSYAHPHLVPLLTRIWALPDDLPHAAGMARPRLRARLVGHQRPLRRGRLSPRTRRRHQHELELARTGKHPPRAGLPRELRRDAVPDRSRHRHDNRGLPLARHRKRLGVVRRKGRADGPLAGRRAAAAGEEHALRPVPGPRNTWPGRDTSIQTHASDRVRR